MSDQGSWEPADLENVAIEVVGNLVSTRILLNDGTEIRILASEKAVSQLVLRYQAALMRLKGL